MAQRVVRPIKFAAFISILVLLAVLLTGCPQAAGRQGPQGIPGSKGDPGAQGASGVDALQAKGGIGAVLINYTDLADAQGNKFLVSAPGGINEEAGATDGDKTDLPAGKTRTAGTVDVSTYFVGGKAPFKYVITLAATHDVGGTFPTPNGGAYAYNVTVPAAGFPADTVTQAEYVTGWVGTLTATDSREISTTNTITFKLNRHPRVKDDAALDTGTQTTQKSSVTGGSVAATAFWLGTSTADQESAFGTKTAKAAIANLTKACPKYNECELDVFTDDDKFTVTVEKMMREGTVTNAFVGQMATSAGNLKLTGLRSTWKGNAHVPVQVDLKATDSKGLTKLGRVFVAVDAAPTVSAAGRTAVQGRTFTVDENDEIIHRNAFQLFSDTEGSIGATNLPATGRVTSADPSIATGKIATSGSGATTTAPHLRVDPVGLGTTVITVTATDSRFQRAELKFSVNVTNLP